MGATGQWVLFNGAKQYTGVESQEFYVKESIDLLSHYRDNVSIVHAPIDRFLASNSKDYDIVLLLGVMHGYLDYYRLLNTVAPICRETLIIEGNYPFPDKGNPKAPIVEIVPNSGMIVAGKEENYRALGSRVSPAALELIMGTLGFEPAGAPAAPKRIKNSLDNFCGDPSVKYNVRFIRSFRRSATIVHSINDVLSDVEHMGSAVQRTPWEKLVGENSKYLEFIAPDKPPIAEKQWAFNEAVAQTFQHEARTNIPDYDRVITVTVEIAERFIAKGARIADIGCALGETLRRLSDRGFSELYGTDSSPYMLGRAYQRKAAERVQYIQTDAFPFQPCSFSLIIANWTAHFVNQRERLLRDVFAALQVGGMLVLTERVLQSAEVALLYRGFKEKMGLSADYIDYKEEALKEVLVSYPVDWYLVALRRIGFSSLDIVHANLGFVTFLAKK
jgi:SAM-dependent methyltransferase